MNDRLDGWCAEPVTGSTFPLGEIRKEKWLAGQYGDGVAPARALAVRCRELWNLYDSTETTIWSSLARYRTGRGTDSARQADRRHPHLRAGRAQPAAAAGRGRQTARTGEGRPAIAAAAVASLAGRGRVARHGQDMEEWS